jgi:hypothetical protein
MPAFEDIAAADYDEPPEVVREWLETSTSLPEAADGPPDLALEEPLSHTHTDMHDSAPNRPFVMQPQHDPHDDLMAHAQYISSLHHGLANAATDPLDQARYIEGLAAALLEFSIPEVWEDVKDMGKRNAGPLLTIMQNVRLVYDRGDFVAQLT